MNCGKPFFTKIVEYFCSRECLYEFKHKQNSKYDDKWLDLQIRMDLKANQKIRDNDERLSYYLFYKRE